jgi:hypothetical protein
MVLLKKNAFHWTLEVEEAFIDLNHAMCTTLVLAAPNLNKTFVVEYDASCTSIDPVLTQDDRPIYFTV